MVLSKAVSMGQELRFDDFEAESYFYKILARFKEMVRGKKGVIFLPCASSKPIQISLTHSYFAPISRHYDPDYAVFIISEPLCLIPYLDEEYPNYNYDPNDMSESERDTFIERMQYFVKILDELKMECYYLGGKHHHSILYASCLGHGDAALNWIHPQKGVRDYHDNAEFLAKVLNYRQDRPIKFTITSISKTEVKIKPIF